MTITLGNTNDNTLGKVKIKCTILFPTLISWKIINNIYMLLKIDIIL